MTKSTMQLLESNRNTHQALQKKEDKMEDDDDDDAASKNKTIKEILEEITGREAWAGKRASKMDARKPCRKPERFPLTGMQKRPL